MHLNPEILARIYLTVFIAVMVSLAYGMYQQVLFVKKQRKDFLEKNNEEFFNSTYLEYLDAKFRNKVQDIHQILNIKDRIKQINMKQKVYNENLGPISNVTHIIVIQVHSNVYYIRDLLESLSVAYGINNALLIFSHDHFSNEMNNLIKGINFVKYIQIFFPYSIQLHPNVFPGNDSKFCSEGYVCKESTLRDPKAAQAKHHWWWGANQVFDNMKITQNFNRTILFLEEGDYVTADLLYVHTSLRHARSYHCPFCELLSMGAHNPKLSQYATKTIISMEIWTNKVSRTGIAFSRNIWNALKANSDVFCYHNDFNWDSSFRYVGEQKWEGNIYMIAVSWRRVFRLKSCDNNNCKGLELTVVKAFLKKNSRNLFPRVMFMFTQNEEYFDEKPAGLWEDIRDHDLCMHFTKNSVWY